MPVQQHVLNWLYSVLTSEYHDVNRAYNDVAQALTQYPTLAPRTDVHSNNSSFAFNRHLRTVLTLLAFSHGANALLLHLTGTLPVNFRGTTYRFPVSIWVPHAYPREPPMVYVVPTEVMMIRPGQHVDPQGLVYHPYLVRWAEFWHKSNLQDLLGIVTDIFAKEPPVISRQQAPPVSVPQPGPTPPPVPPLPPALAPRPTTQDQSAAEQERPPPPPPKGPQITSFNRQNTGSVEPPLPPLPPTPLADSHRPSRYDSAPPLPPQANSAESTGPRFVRPSVQNQANHTPIPEHTRPTQPHYFNPAQAQPPLAPQRQWQAPQQPQTWHPAPQPPQLQAKPPPPPDLLDEPLVLNLPTSSTIAAPPIPPNPEKDALLHQLAQTLCAIRVRARQQNDSSMAGLQAQRTAMLSAMPALQAEAGQLAQLSNVLTSNSNILHDALHKADGVIEGSRSHPVPDVDELLVAPTVVANQLYTLVAEERALGDAIFMLGRAVERGRIAPAVFAKMTRSLAREWYLKKALVRKIGQGMALAP
ncbi:UEV domain-containing protein [Dactylonectria macrodidyma]|uniref:UEV domain-containing protein n=1 Tax=Dactylonectria macrodidyma TaxID=307937 RepID=A0A9P9DLY3_9HYPO|nr:UEV domain-containing protein [Dactylonectria macrodidyma]